MYYSTTYHSPIGAITLGCDNAGENLTGLWVEKQKYLEDTIPGSITTRDDIPLFTTIKQWLDRYFSGEKPSIAELPLAPIGGEFRQEVWQILCEIPHGKLTTYGAIAKQIAEKRAKKTMSAQAVGGAVGHNPISIIIPCHRVVGSNGSLTGYAGGLDLKIKLLEIEHVDMTHLFVPKKGTAL
jgi:methylated-DNA-[protein]-cysteine S-methyltransferase